MKRTTKQAKRDGEKCKCGHRRGTHDKLGCRHIVDMAMVELCGCRGFIPREKRNPAKVTTWRGWGIIWDSPAGVKFLQTHPKKPSLDDAGKIVRVVATCTEVKR